ncbi:hypothetical protein HAX54_051191 [Datura stramonium]|uniref:Uncharacterized protein n=1 Tax=Datura stramonium TaxID=4076 RepID=A0ABS8WQZ4_DATST|nr:hypothetical protein [Datura stramonium]
MGESVAGGSRALLNFPLRINSGEPEPIRVGSKRTSTSPERSSSSSVIRREEEEERYKMGRGRFLSDKIFGLKSSDRDIDLPPPRALLFATLIELWLNE